MSYPRFRLRKIVGFVSDDLDDVPILIGLPAVHGAKKKTNHTEFEGRKTPINQYGHVRHVMSKKGKTADEIAELTGTDVEKIRRGMSTFTLVEPDDE